MRSWTGAAGDLAINRIASGAAHPSDWEGGHIVATLAVNQMMKNPVNSALISMPSRPKSAKGWE